MCKAIDTGFLTTFPGLTTKQIRKHPPRSQATEKGHMNAQRANLRSTKPKIKVERTNNVTLTPTSEIGPAIVEYDPCDFLTPQCKDSQDPIQRVIPISVPQQQIPTRTPMLIPDDPRTTIHDLPNVPVLPAIETPPILVTIPNPNKRLKYEYASCIQMTGHIHTDQTGKFLVFHQKNSKIIATEANTYNQKASVNQKEKRTQGLLHHLRSMPGHRRPIRIQTPHRGPQQALLAQCMLQRSRTPRSRKPTGRYPRH